MPAKTLPLDKEGRAEQRTCALSRPAREVFNVYGEGFLTLPAHVQRIPGLMLFDLESQEIIDCAQGFGTAGRHTNPSALFRLFELVLDIALELLHRWHARWNLIVDQHWCVEVSVGEHFCDMPQVHSDLIPALLILRRVSGNFDGAAV